MEPDFATERIDCDTEVKRLRWHTTMSVDQRELPKIPLLARIVSDDFQKFNETLLKAKTNSTVRRTFWKYLSIRRYIIVEETEKESWSNQTWDITLVKCRNDFNEKYFTVNDHNQSCGLKHFLWFNFCFVVCLSLCSKNKRYRLGGLINEFQYRLLSY